MERSDYNKHYYQNKYKQIIQNKKRVCECCQQEFSAWNMYKHNKSRKHFLNTLSEEDRKKYFEEKSQEKIRQKIERLKNFLI